MLRDLIRGMEVQLVDLVLQSSPLGPSLDWLRIPLEGAAAAGNFVPETSKAAAYCRGEGRTTARTGSTGAAVATGDGKR